MVLSTSAEAAQPVGTLSKILGTVKIVRGKQTIKAKTGAEVFETDTLITEAKSAAKVLFKDGSSFMAMENAQFKLDEYKIKGTGNDVSLKSAISVGKGVVRFFVKPRTGQGKNDASFKTTNAVMGIRGTSGFIDNSVPSKTKVVVLTGKVEVASPFAPGKAVMVIPNHVTEVIANNPPSAPVKAPENLVSSLSSEASRVEPSPDGQPGNAGAGDGGAPQDQKEDSAAEPQKDTDKQDGGGVKSEEDKPAAPPKKTERKAADRDGVVFSPVGDKPQLSPSAPGPALLPASRVAPSDKNVSAEAPPPGQIQPSNLPDFKEAQKINQRVDGLISNTVQKVETPTKTKIKVVVPQGPITTK